MATQMARSVLRSALRSNTKTPATRRNFASSADHDDARETKKWQYITYAGIVSCTGLATVILSKGHHHYDEPPAYPYLHIRNKEFPWGPDGLFEKKEQHH